MEKMKKNLLVVVALLLVFLTACAVGEQEATTSDGINFSMNPIGGAGISSTEEEPVVYRIVVSGDDEEITFYRLLPIDHEGEFNEEDGMDEVKRPLVSIGREDSFITYTYLDEENEEVTEEVEILSVSLLKNQSTNDYFEWSGPTEWAPATE